MRSRVVILVALAVVFLGLSSAPAVTAQDAPTPPQVGEREDAPTYALHGPYWVGTRTLVMGADTDRPMNVLIWYPALNPEGLPEATVYSVETGSGFPPMTISGKAIAGAPVDLRAAPYPLVVYSPGGGASPAHHASLIEHLASYGFVAMGGEHPGNTSVDFFGSFAGPEAEAAYIELMLANQVLRPLDMTRLIDFAAEINAPDAPLAGMIDSERVTTAGVSFGGYAALVAGGGRLDFGALSTWLETNTPDDPVVALYPDHEEALAALVDGDVTLGELWPSLGDPRVDAIISMAGDSYLFEQAGLAEITIPMMVLGGTADTGTLYDWGTGPSFDYASSAEKVRIAFSGAEHMIAGAACEDAPDVAALFGSWACMDPVWDKARVHDLINHFTTAFLLAELAGDADARAALAPSVVAFPGVEYSAAGF